MSAAGRDPSLDVSTMRIVSFAAAAVVVLSGMDVRVVQGQSARDGARAATAGAPPAARRGEHVDVHHGTRVPDPYRWMEEMTSPETREWVRAQDAHARRFAAAVPGRDAVRERIARIAGVRRLSAPWRAGEAYFYLELPATGSGPGTSLLVQDGFDDQPRVLVGADEVEAAGGAITRSIPAPDGRRVAYTIASGGSRWETLRVRDVASGRDLADVLTGVHGGLSRVTWAPDGSGFYYDRFEVPPEGAERSARIGGERVFFHHVGTSQEGDALVFERPDHPQDALTHGLTESGRFLVIAARPPSANGDRVFVLDRSRPVAAAETIVPEPEAAYTFVGGRGSRLLFHTDLRAPRGRIVAVDVERPGRGFEEVVPEASEAITTWAGVSWVGDRVIVTYLKDAVLAVRVFELDGAHAYDLQLPALGSIWSGFAGRPGDPHAFYVLSGLVDPGTVYRLDVRTGESTLFRRPELDYDPDDFVTEQVFYEGRDGTRIPMYLAHRRGLPRDGRAPVFMYGYGSFGWAAAPWFQPHVVAWLERGGVWALPNTRGGGEYGEPWHRAGRGREKPTAVDDYLAASEWLIENGWTRAERLVANGSSAGGPVVGAAVTRRPELYGAVVLDFPALDLFRYHEFTGAVAGGWPAEYGTVADPADFEVLRTYSPYHVLEAEKCYPPTLVTPGENDEITPPLHAYKFVAALQHAQGCEAPVLLRVSWGGGHGYGANLEDSIDNWADQLAFLARVLELEGWAPESGARGDVAVTGRCGVPWPR